MNRSVAVGQGRWVRLSAAAILVLGAAAVAQAADRYWVGSGGNWSATANWSTGSGGGGGASLPGDADTAIFDAASGASVVDSGYAGTVADVRMTSAFANTVTQQRDLSVTNDFRVEGGTWRFTAGVAGALDVGHDMYVSATVQCQYRSTSGYGAGRVFTVDGDLTVTSTGVIDADGMGFTEGSGPGKGQGVNSGSGAHGGQSPAYDPNVYNSHSKTYGSVTNPISLGSGGSAGMGPCGGGAIRLDVGGTATVDGKIRATGTGTFSGAGGSILIRAKTLTGASTGLITANSSRGGGGRIALYYETDTYSGKIQAYCTGSEIQAGSGTIYRKNVLADTYGTLIVDGYNRPFNAVRSGFTSLSDLDVATYRFDSIVLTNAAVLMISTNNTLTVNTLDDVQAKSPNCWLANAGTLVYDNALISDWNKAFGYIDNGGAGLNVASTLSLSTNWVRQYNGRYLTNADVTVKTNATFTANGFLALHSLTVKAGGAVTHSQNYTAKLSEMNLICADALTVEAGGFIRADGLGHECNSGSGRGYGSNYGGGGSHGGQGAPRQDSPYTSSLPPYGSITNPVTMGSGGGTDGHPASGGGVIRLVVTNIATIHGTVSADGAASQYRAGGSGGSIWMTVGTLTGGSSGLIKANGIASSTPGGAGGRIAVEYGANTFEGNIRAYGGSSGVYRRGGAGTVYLKQADEARGRMIVDNNNLTNAEQTIITLATTGREVGDVVIRNSAVMTLATGVTFTAYGSWSNSAAFVAGTNSTVTLAGSGVADVTGSNTFWNLTCTEPGKTLTFEAGRTNTILGTLYLREAALVSSVPSSWWYLTVTGPHASNDVDNLAAVQDSNADGGQTIAGRGSNNLGRNVNWTFTPKGTMILIK